MSTRFQLFRFQHFSFFPMSQKNETLIGGRKLTVNFETLPDGTMPPAEAVLVRQVPLREYEAGLLVFEDEFARTAFICGRDKKWVLTLTPESYEALRVAAEEVNAQGFFVYCQRRVAEFLALPAHVRAQFLAAPSTSPTGSPAPQPRRV